MNWECLVLGVRNIRGAPSSSFQRRHYLIEATDHETAYRRSLELNQRRIAQYAPEGIEDLLFISDVPKDGSELSWSEAELSAQELQDEIQPKERMHAFVSNQPKHSGWYVGRILLCEVHDEGSH